MKRTNEPRSQPKASTPKNIEDIDLNIPKTAEQLLNDEIGEELAYINRHIDPILSKMMIKIINENPPHLVDYMIDYLQQEEDNTLKHDFKNKLNKTIGPKRSEDPEGALGGASKVRTFKKEMRIVREDEEED